MKIDRNIVDIINSETKLKYLCISGAYDKIHELAAYLQDNKNVLNEKQLTLCVTLNFPLSFGPKGSGQNHMLQKSIFNNFYQIYDP